MYSMSQECLISFFLLPKEILDVLKSGPQCFKQGIVYTTFKMDWKFSRNIQVLKVF